jgi:uridine phosphorylase
MIQPVDSLTTEDVIISPRRGKNERALPRTGLLLVNPKEAEHGHSLVRERGGEKINFPHSKLSVCASGRFFVAGPAVSSPIAAMIAEKLIVLGAERLYALSWCGAVSPKLLIGDTVIGGIPLSGEGTSRYYTTDVEPAPSSLLSQRLQKYAARFGFDPVTGRIWSTDAPYRESRSFLRKMYLEQQIYGVDMEYSALCAVCMFRKIEFASLFLVSDELWGEKWKPGFSNKGFQEKNRLLTQALVAEDMPLSD